MNRISIIVASLIAILLIAIIVTTLVQNETKSVDTTGIVYTDFDITFPDSAGNVVVLNNFLNNQSVRADVQNPGLYFLGDDISIQPETGKLPNYVVTYDKESGQFNVTLLEKPFSQARIEAQVYLKELLQADEDTLCKLQYLVTVPGYVDTKASGIDYRFSFCPGATAL
jgi:hypothetical protein